MSYLCKGDIGPHRRYSHATHFAGKCSHIGHKILVQPIEVIPECHCEHHPAFGGADGSEGAMHLERDQGILHPLAVELES
jgi:hypothetical protein